MSQMEKAGHGQAGLGHAGHPASASTAQLTALPAHCEHTVIVGQRSQQGKLCGASISL